MLNSSTSLIHTLDYMRGVRTRVCGFYYSIMFNHVTFLIFKILCAFFFVFLRLGVRAAKAGG